MNRIKEKIKGFWILETYFKDLLIKLQWITFEWTSKIFGNEMMCLCLNEFSKENWMAFSYEWKNLFLRTGMKCEWRWLTLMLR